MLTKKAEEFHQEGVIFKETLSTTNDNHGEAVELKTEALIVGV